MGVVTSATSAADAAGIGYRLVEQGNARSAAEAAEKRGISIGQLAKTLVIRVDEGAYVLVLVPGDRGLDYAKLRSYLGVRRLTMPSPDEAKQATGYDRGTITPLGAGGWPVIMDDRLAAHDEISLGAGIAGWAIHLDPASLADAAGVVTADISKPPD